MASWEVAHLRTGWTKQSPEGDANTLLLVRLGTVNTFLWPFLAIAAERAVFGLPSIHSDTIPGFFDGLIARFKGVGLSDAGPMQPQTTVHISHLRKSYDSRRFFFFGRKRSVVAIEDRSFDVPSGEIFCLLGRNGAAKSTTLSIIPGFTPRSSGVVQYAPDLGVGIVKYLSSKLSGGQKRKLQLACAIAGGSKLLLLDEISSGLDPFSRHAILKVLADVRGSCLDDSSPATIADYFGDEIAILKAPGRLLAIDSPVALKTRLGDVHPVTSIVRAGLLSVNASKEHGRHLPLRQPDPVHGVQGMFAFALLVWVDWGYPLPRWVRRGGKVHAMDVEHSPDVLAEAARAPASNDALIVDHTKQFGNKVKPIVDDVTFGDTFALIGPKGAGKMMALDVVRRVERPTRGDVRVTSFSIVRRCNRARARRSACVPSTQQSACISPRPSTCGCMGGSRACRATRSAHDVYTLLAVSGLRDTADELASDLNGGNQRKISLACALIGDRPVIPIDKFSSGVDPFKKRQGLEELMRERADVMTTHSMEDVDAFSNRVAIIASKLLAVGTPVSLKSHFATYEVHAPAEDVHPLVTYLCENGLTRTASTEAVFLAIVRANNVKEENTEEVGEKKR
ncbi:hypothetical protein CspeluHIS016_0112530 [Cutaneotrichosporon spelunceum]|uniref:ABC transporter domain-containing protein n=1 Tax=Cutaneotrichosporon spelunceum TaxID=1672016 RepID=A0AAD3YAA9_9TREE|nr:hypothetical protein CspeluHIS016_0112530 [Cutaneotrichosporon spelunceum]